VRGELTNKKLRNLYSLRSGVELVIAVYPFSHAFFVKSDHTMLFALDKFFFLRFQIKPIQMKPVRYTSNSTLKYFLDHNFLSITLFGLSSLYVKGNQFVGT
jgi:hypothetical protein